MGLLGWLQNEAHEVSQDVSQFRQGFSGATPNHTQPQAAAGSDAIAAQPTSPWGRAGQGVADFFHGVQQEGLGGILDAKGMMDRQQAQRDLANRFQVVPDNFVGPRLPNQVSEKEYEHIAHTYSDIRMGRGDLTINTSEQTNPVEAARYKQQVMNTIADQMMTSSGRNEVERLHNNVLVDDAGKARLDSAGHEQHHSTQIRALYNSNAQGNPLDTNNDGKVDANDIHDEAHRFNGNAYADATDTTKRGDWFRTGRVDAHGNPVNDASGQQIMDRGKGTDSTIWFNPQVTAGNCNRADVILQHEMAHAVHETQGTMASDAKGQTEPGIANFERQAVGLPNSGHYPGDPDGCTENSYREERNLLGDRFLPRTNYGGTMPGQAPDAKTAQTAWDAYHKANP